MKTPCKTTNVHLPISNASLPAECTNEQKPCHILLRHISFTVVSTTPINVMVSSKETATNPVVTMAAFLCYLATPALIDDTDAVTHYAALEFRSIKGRISKELE